MTLRPISTSRLLVVGAAIALAGVAVRPPAALAADPAPTRTVSTADLRLESAAGQRVLQQRVRAAARSVCAPLDGASLRERLAWRDCVAQAIVGARPAAVPAPASAWRATQASSPATAR